MTDLFTVELNALTNDERYSAIADFARAQPGESNRHDFKSMWTPDAVKDVAAFANTFGGLLIIGVDKNQADAQATVAGVESSSELTTRIASSIATNISPTPSYDIVECHKPGDLNKRLCVVRVRSGTTLYLVTKKGIIPPVWLRNADQTIAADAAQLRSLIERQGSSIEAASQFLIDRSHSIFDEMIIGFGYEEGPLWTFGPWQRSATHFKLALLPVERRSMRLDAREENKFVGLIHQNYRRVAETLGRVAMDAANRDSDFYEYRWFHKHLGYEGRWRITNRLEVAHATQVNEGTEWSLVDIVMYTILLLKVGATWWKEFNYFGDGILSAELGVRGLKVLRGTQGQFLKIFGPIGGDLAMGPDVLKENSQRTDSRAVISISSGTMLDDIPRIVTAIMNSLLRSLGHAVIWAEFEENVRVIAQAAD